jgi:hypothetical protein
MRYLILAFLLSALFVQAQIPKLVPYRKGDKWGYADFNKKIVIEPKYDGVSMFTDKITAVNTDTAFYLVDETGNRVGNKTYDDVSDFYEGLAAVKKDSLFGFINNKGEEVIPIQFSSVGKFKDGRAAILVNKKIGFIEDKGTVVIEPKFDAAFDSYNEGYVLVKKDNRVFYIDKQGKELQIDETFRPLTPFSEGKAAVMKKVPSAGTNDTTTYWGFINTKGTLAFNWLPLGYDIVTSYKGGYCVVKKNKMYFYVNNTGQLMKDTFYVFNDFSEGYATAIYYTSKLGDTRADAYILDKNLKPVKRIMNVANTGKFADGLVPVQSSFSGLVQYYDAKGNLAFDKSYEDGGDFKNGIAVVKKNGKPGCIDTKGNEYWED